MFLTLLYKCRRSQSIAGYLIGALFKHIDAVAAIFADLAAMLITATVSALFFDLKVNVLFCLGFACSCLSFWVYYGGEGGCDAMEDSTRVGDEAESEKQKLLRESGTDSDVDGNDTSARP